MLTDIAGSITPMKSAAKNLRKWMKPEKRKTMFPLNLLGGRSRIEYQPLGVVGVISPWNFPVNLTFGPLAEILAAGNRAIIKPSEFTPTVSEVMAEVVAEAWDEKEVAIFTGGPGSRCSVSAQPALRSPALHRRHRLSPATSWQPQPRTWCPSPWSWVANHPLC